jgi:DNA-binding NarL/FixJ family response regulator
MTIRVGICDDQPLIRDGLRVQLGLADEIDVVGEASNGEQAVTLARRERPDVLLMDIRMPVLDGIEATRRIVDGAGTDPDHVRPRRAGVRRAVRRGQRVPAEGRDTGGGGARRPSRRRR